MMFKSNKIKIVGVTLVNWLVYEILAAWYGS